MVKDSNHNEQTARGWMSKGVHGLPILDNLFHNFRKENIFSKVTISEDIFFQVYEHAPTN